MARTWGFCPTRKPITAAAFQVIFTPNEIDASKVVAFHIGFEEDSTANAACTPVSRLGQAGALAGRIKVKAGSRTIVDMTFAQLQAYIERFAPNRLPPGLGGALDTAVVGRVFTIPFYILDAANEMASDACQFPPGSSAQVEIEGPLLANSTGAIWLGWTKTTEPAQFTKQLLAAPMNVPASARNARVPLQSEGFVQSICVPVANIGNLRVKLQGFEVLDLPGQVFNGFSAGSFNPDFLQAVQAEFDGTSQTSHQWIKLGQGLGADPANSELLVTSGASMAATEEYVIESLIPLETAEVDA